MYRFFIKTTEGTATIINGDRMIEKGDNLCVYSGDDLVGMFRIDYIIDAHRTDKG
jgi:hypothetical protein